ncbi:hypothetical protein [Leptolyngbya sp. FACHB-261]|uniref:hypothetical protein n=1 Tax=Leptolyngbya sp. FACHB-261 TaxID=2692806 RepID=UPI001685AA8D|nr:hypothetical protein [Leptolyngbya sp. FACHB-261]MBD2099878.1 hypothetical protein [Leptolyngbya sp. FACHB-261]
MKSASLTMAASSGEVSSLSTNPIFEQATELWATLSDPCTALTYKNAASRTWVLLRQIVRLIFLLTLLAVVVVVWIWSVGFQSGRAFRSWLNTEEPTPTLLLQKTADILLWPFKVTVDWSKKQIKEQLGIELKPLWPAQLETSKLNAGQDSPQAISSSTPTSGPGQSK